MSLNMLIETPAGFDYTGADCSSRMRDEWERRMRRPGRPLSFDATTYARRNVVERCVNRLKEWGGIATRYEKRAVNYRAAVCDRCGDDLVGLMNRQLSPTRTPTAPCGDVAPPVIDGVYGDA
jgi:hypothetical protein